MDSAATVARPKGLPQPLTKFVGRDAELRSLKSRLRESRLVTIIGTGGAGKTRLATELVRTASDHWADGAWWIELAGADDVVGTVVATAELPGRGKPIDVVTSWLATRHALLVLDNCEHLIAASASFCNAVLERCPSVTILATSREPLGIPGEARWPLSPLIESDALRLFEARAVLVRPDFNVKAHSDTVARICERLDRLPLAIEMAAARLDVMSEPEVLANLDDRFRVLASTSRLAPERQQTMTAAIDWSHRLLTDAEAKLFRRLAVFQGGFTLDAARAVASDPAGGDVLATLTGLVQKSMVVADRHEDGTRFRLLESHREYALVKLGESGELDSTHSRHFEFFRSQKWTSRDALNFWAALAWARDHLEDGGLDLALEVADAGYSDQARALKVLLELLDRPAVQGAPRARAMNLAARHTARQGDYVKSRSLADASIAAARKLKDKQLLAHMLAGAGVVYQAGDELDAARRMYDEALPLLKESGNRGLAIEVQNQAAVLATEQGNLAEAREMLTECIAYSRAAGERALTARYLESIANVELEMGDAAAAESHWREALATFRRLSDPFGAIWCVGGLALVAGTHGDFERALRLAAVAERMSREWSLSAWPSRKHHLDAMKGRAEAKLGSRKADDAWQQGVEMNAERALDYSLSGDAGQDKDVDAGPLSKREREVAAMVAGGLTNKQIAGRLFIAERTAEGHVERIRDKLGVRSRTEVATWAIAHGITPRA